MSVTFHAEETGFRAVTSSRWGLARSFWYLPFLLGGCPLDVQRAPEAYDPLGEPTDPAVHDHDPVDEADEAAAADDERDELDQPDPEWDEEPEGDEDAVDDVPERPIIYLNRHGGTYTTAGASNSSTNETTIPRVDQVTIPPFESDEYWGVISECVHQLFAPFDVEVTEDDPGETEHLEAVFGGLADDLGFADSIGGLGTTYDADCNLEERSVVFVFTGYGEDFTWAHCDAAGMEIGHALGLNHSNACGDPMFALWGGWNDCWPDDQAFRDVEGDCLAVDDPATPIMDEEYETCRCGGETQNSYRYLMDFFGPAR